jgi:hypothetical protein
MSMTLLQLVQAAAGEMGLGVPNTVAGNLSDDVIQQLALINAVGGELQREFDWEALSTEYRFTTQYLTTTGDVTANSATVTNMAATTGLDNTYMASGIGVNNDTYVLSNDGPDQITLSQVASTSGVGVTLNFGKTKYEMPADFDRQIDRTHYDKSKHWEMLGPETPQQWQWLKSSYISTGPRLRYRIMGGFFQIWPQMATPEYVGFEYISRNWVTDSSGNTKSQFTADTDTCIFPDRLMILGLKLKYFEIKGFDTTAFARDFSRQLSIAKSNDQGSPTLSMAPRLSSVLIGWENIPDSNYGS